MGMTAKDWILARLASEDRAIPLHALDIPGVSQCSASARLRELAKAGLVVSVRVPGAKYTAWKLAPKELTLDL